MLYTFKGSVISASFLILAPLFSFRQLRRETSGECILYYLHMTLDKENIVSIRLGNEKAFEELIREMYPSVYFYVKNIVKNYEDAEEITQDTFVKLWDKRKLIDEDANIKAYVFVIAKNFALLNLREKKKNPVECFSENLELELKMLASQNPESIILLDETKCKIREAVAGMPDQRKKVFLLSRQFGYTYKEIASQLDISVKTVEKHMGKALQEMRMLLKKEDRNALSLAIN